tara:strand:- start:579 stop:1151 length:573 start_codon:yes stop_codon:yes gene_type:complete
MSKRKNDKIVLFGGDDGLFKQSLIGCNSYFEYGVGASTRWVLENTKSKIISVDTDKKWINTIDISNNDYRVKLNWVNLGELESWGRPKSYEYRDHFIDYISNVWGFNEKADVILIDGRFRVACFLYSLINAKINSLIIFDDYNNRPYYHVIEEIIPVYKTCGRQAVFKVPKNINKSLAENILYKFLYVFD